MNWNEVTREEARKDSFGNGLESGAYLIDIKEAHIFKSSKSKFQQITLKVIVNGGDKYLKLNTTTKDGDKGFDSTRVVQLCFLLGKQGKDIQEIQTNTDNVFAIPQLIGKVGCVIESRPAFACKPNDNGDQYPEYKVVQFYEYETGKTIAEKIDKKEPAKIGEIVQVLKEREYTPYKQSLIPNNSQQQQQSAPASFNVGSDILEDMLPF